MALINLMDLEDEQIVGGLAGVKVMIYGQSDTGKTSQLAKMDRPLLLMAESGGGAVKCKKVPIIKWKDFLTCVEQLTNEKTYKGMYEKYRSIIIDTGENLIKLSDSAVCNEAGVRSLSQMNTGEINGYVASRDGFAQQINKLASFGYSLFIICHEEKVKMTDENGEEYIFTQPIGTSNEKSSMRFLRNLCDFTIYLKPNGIDPETNKFIPSTAICKQTKYVFARSRFAMQTFINVFTAKNLEEAIIKAKEQTAIEEESELVGFTLDTSDYTIGDYLAIIKPYFKKLYKLYPSEVDNLVDEQLPRDDTGKVRKISSATEDEKINLENIYNVMVSMACTRGIVIDID